MRAASFRSDGMHAGRVVIHRNIEGPQLWTVVVVLERDREIDSITLQPKERVAPGDLEGLVRRSIDELCGEPGRITRAKLNFFVRRQK